MSIAPTLMTMMQELIATPSVSSASPQWDQSNQGVIEKLETWLSGLGFATEVQPIAGFPGKFNLIATYGSGPGGLVLSGHTDTVPFNAELWQSDPFKLTEKNQRLYGLGSCDMKAFFALAIEAARPLLDQPFQAPLIILATADEETSMCGARALAEAGYPKARAAVIGEPTGLRPGYMHKGMMMERIELLGQSGHSSDPSLGNNALEAMHEVMAELLELRAELQARHNNPLFKVQTPTMNFGCIHGGDNPNRICGNCALEFDLRPLPGMDNDELRSQIIARAGAVAERRGVAMRLESLFPGIQPFANRQDSELVRLAERLTGHGAESVAFGTEGPFLQQLGMDTIVMGPGSINQAHQPDEYLALSQIPTTLGLLRQFITHYCLSDGSAPAPAGTGTPQE